MSEFNYDTIDETKEELFDYLEALRESGVTNMYGAGEYLEYKYELNSDDANTILLQWMKEF